jgi:uncharacterized membrane protein (UPF0127 family)
MLFPLDIAFISEDMVITEVYRNVQPGYLVTSMSSVSYFLEVNAGRARMALTAEAMPHFSLQPLKTP